MATTLLDRVISMIEREDFDQVPGFEPLRQTIRVGAAFCPDERSGIEGMINKGHHQWLERRTRPQEAWGDVFAIPAVQHDVPVARDNRRKKGNNTPAGKQARAGKRNAHTASNLSCPMRLALVSEMSL